MKRHAAYFTYDEEADAYYFAPGIRTAPPYKVQKEVRAILDIAHDGTLAGVELVFDLGDIKPPPMAAKAKEPIELP